MVTKAPASQRTTAGLSKSALDLLRLARLDMSAAERRQLTNSEVVTRLVEAWRAAQDRAR